MPTGTRPAAKEDKGRQYHCARMVEFRRKKKQEREELHKELRRLQRAMKQQEEFVRNEAASSRQFRDSSTMVLLREVIVEKEALLTQNIALRKEIDRHEPIQTLVQEEPQCYSEYQSRSDKLMLSPSVDQVGWQVHVPNGEQSFYVHPFSRKEFDAFPNPFDAGYTAGSSSYSYAGTYLGWKVYRVPTRENPLSIHAGNIVSVTGLQLKFCKNSIVTRT
ncbi:hypothetical protein BBO99_00006080 [Phytophthora kernoviae]|uniref:Uncharacterized protein n=2 Tax=Phytophthora kernoviae TaxID=325452 RepID=A0A3R7GXM5_9STRA|nr:hypothetical protein G195_011067 [Phytophthora kernoviae 00238/432]KAG2522307.1 hypothetical protein JM16_005800 [Phytophthora kernoviae]KAG2523931.1 hypothetical protein JM18_005594 [Phytophthora kernoviae]RLM95714.1 hypothetical protein BBI17_006148 [Phytophthora kernoviae]RLN78261.1 hypothetical protein BBO99_00006080 [Phytophthora kernoviae]